MKKGKANDSAALSGRALDLAGLVEYQRGTIVSRTVVARKTGTVTLFAFDKGQGLSEHTAPFDAMAVIVDGEAGVLIAGKPRTVKTGEMIIMPANVPHSLNALKKFKMLLIMIRS
jgi:quercetin dioxygenase-like cupin family protein